MTAMTKVLVFTDTKRLADQLYKNIEKHFPDNIGVIHSNKSQHQRFEAVNRFHNGDFRILIATDVIARGIDIAEVSHVINFDTPEVPEDYIHRIGRTGRADKHGNAIIFISKKEKPFQTRIEKLMKMKIPMEKLPEEVIVSKELIVEELPVLPQKEIQV
jgi:ATP-dependent RNA helicase RhlE